MASTTVTKTAGASKTSPNGNKTNTSETPMSSRRSLSHPFRPHDEPPLGHACAIHGHDIVRVRAPGVVSCCTHHFAHFYITKNTYDRGEQQLFSAENLTYAMTWLGSLLSGTSYLPFFHPGVHTCGCGPPARPPRGIGRRRTAVVVKWRLNALLPACFHLSAAYKDKIRCHF